MNLQKKLKPQFIAKQYYNCRKKLFENLEGKKYIESNNFLFGCVEPLSEHQKIKVLHIVRHPEDYIQSHLKHGFWYGHKRFFAKHIPYWIEYLGLSNDDKNDSVKILAKRWYYVNTVIAETSRKVSYLLIRFEDLFSSDKETATGNMKKILNFFNLKLNENVDLSAVLAEKKNIGKKRKVKSGLLKHYSQYIKRECGELMRKFNYTIHEN